MKRATLAIALCLIAAPLQADGISNPPSTDGGTIGFIEGINNLGIGGGTSVVGCVGTGLNFTLACNSQYIGLM